MSKNSYETNYEFILRLNETNIICQRYFKIPKGLKFNQNSFNSIDLKEAIDTIVDDIIEDLKLATYIDHMEENIGGYYYKPDINTSDNDDYFVFEFKYRGKSKMIRRFNANLYPTTVRRSVDIRERIPEFIDIIIDSLTKENRELNIVE